MAAFQEALEELEATGIRVVAASTDEQDNARKMRDHSGATFPIGYGLDMIETAELIGGYYEVRRNILHATGLLCRPDGTVGAACYSTGPIGRIEPDDVRRLVAFWVERAETRP